MALTGIAGPVDRNPESVMEFRIPVRPRAQGVRQRDVTRRLG
jgi:hypothetical protein